ncbi:MAG: hypothetical protein ACR2ID_02905 [Chthoniobacterales bacterium]
MAGLLEGFIQQFTSGAPGANAEEFHDRFSSTEEADRDFDSETYHEAAADHLQQLPEDQFHSAAQQALAQAPPQERADLLGGLLRTLTSSGGLGALGGMAGAGGAGAIGQIAQMLGLGSTDPRQMSGDDGTKLLNYARKERPDALRATVADKPWFLKALGNPILMGVLTMAATRLLSRQQR